MSETLISEDDKKTLRDIFQKRLKNPVTLATFVSQDNCEYCKEETELVKELAETSELIKPLVADISKEEAYAKKLNVDKVPAISMIAGDRDFHVRYFGLPAGHEFSAFIDDVIDVSTGSSRLTPAGKARVKKIDKPVHIEVYVTPTCPYCPRAVRMAHQMAIENPLIVGDMVEAMEFPDLADKYEVMSVPKMVINDTYHFVGALPEPQFIEQIELALSGAPSPDDE
ncbi:MAG: protein disulfide oxidoreductase [Thermoprotei archaeon]|nr:thioredoxin family protein [TACK group archaeon]